MNIRVPPCSHPGASAHLHHLVDAPVTDADGRYEPGSRKRACRDCGWVEPGSIRQPCRVEGCGDVAMDRFLLCAEHGSGRRKYKTCGVVSDASGRAAFCWVLTEREHCRRHEARR